MSDENKPNQNNHESRGGGNVWLVLILIIAAVLLSAFLFGSTDRRLRYPDLMALLKATADARAEATAGDHCRRRDRRPCRRADDDPARACNQNRVPMLAPARADDTSESSLQDAAASKADKPARIVVASTKNPEILIEYSDLQDIQVSEGAITGSVMYRSLGSEGKTPTKEPKRVEFQTIRDTNNES